MDKNLVATVERNEANGWVQQALIVAVATGRPIRYVVGYQTPGKRRYFDSATVCAECVAEPRGMARLVGICSRAKDLSGEAVMMSAPKKVNPASKRTSCVVCKRWAFPELLLQTND